MCVMGIDFDFLTTIFFQLEFGTVQMFSGIFYLHFIVKVSFLFFNVNLPHFFFLIQITILKESNHMKC
jgi:hypothetical protein